MSNGNYAILGEDRYPFHVWYDEDNRAIHLTCTDPRLTDESGQKPGFFREFTANPHSADYDPANFNRFARYLRQQGKAAPDEVPIHPRQLAQRPRVIEALGAGG
jgi:hypothetical protein